MDRSMGFIVGLMISAVLVVIIFKISNKDGRLRTEYDERQLAVRGKAYMYAFYTGGLAEALIMCLLMTGIELPLEPYALVFAGIIAACTVLGGYCIWNDVYWGLNNNHKRYNIILAVALVLNILPVAGALYTGTLLENGKFGLPFLNLAVLMMFAVLFVLWLLKGLFASKEERDG